MPYCSFFDQPGLRRLATYPHWNLILNIGPTFIEDTFAEAFSMRYSRIVVTAANRRWLDAAIHEFSGYGSSVIGCDAEVGLESWLADSETLDGRPGASFLIFGFSADAVQKAIVNRTGQCLMTCPTTAVFNGLPIGDAVSTESPVESIPLGKHLRFFGDGFQKSKLIGDRRFWRVPVMDGEFIVEDTVGVTKGVAGGNFLMLATDQMTCLTAAEKAVDAIAELANVITPFPGGVVRSGSKVGSRYAALRASTNEAYCPTLLGRVTSSLPKNVGCVYEIVIDGTSFDSVAQATQAGIRAAVGEGVISISAGNYGGKLGKHHFHLRNLF
ncbi:MAG: formylmethanofuran--tetrahydromethanopterin N-formyltransferase [Mariniblastus sp.]|jgi:formylmethanofuran--tetrahydromethanopterin N-formyltransferase